MPSPAREPWWRRAFGRRAEAAAARFLRAKGYQILDQNFTCRLGELDLVGVDPDRSIVFVEVRSTESGDCARPAASVDLVKQRKLTRLALYYMKTHKLLEMNVRFDVLAISWPAGSRLPVIEHFERAFEATDRFQFFS